MTTPTWSATQGTLERYERPGLQGKWKAVGEKIPVVVGRAGMALTMSEKIEGDGNTPAGHFSLEKVYGYDENPGTKLPYQKSTENLECVDDSKSKFYNQIVDKSDVTMDWKSSEKMLRKDKLYKYVVTVSHNPKNQAGKGSCIFLHVWRGKSSPTAGCTAMKEEDLRELILWLDPEKDPRFVVFPEQRIGELKAEWGID